MIQMPDEAYNALYVIKTHYIMRVLKFYPETQTVDLIQDVYEFTNTPLGTMTRINEFGQEVVVALKEPAILHNIPVKQLRWGQFEIQCCPVEGDTGYIEVMTNDIRDWIQHGSRSIPWSDSHFAKESCVFVPFIANFANRSQTYPEDNTQLVIRSKNATFKIKDDNNSQIDVETTAQTVHVNAANGIYCVGDTDIQGNITVTGNVTITGDMSVTGKIEATDEIKSDVDVIAAGVSLVHHTHLVPGASAIVPSPSPTPPTGEPIPQGA